jgi:hypothetical protein
MRTIFLKGWKEGFDRFGKRPHLPGTAEIAAKLFRAFARNARGKAVALVETRPPR